MCIRNEHLTETKIRQVTIILLLDKFFCITRTFRRNSRMWYIFQFFPTFSFNLFYFFLYIQQINELPFTTTICIFERHLPRRNKCVAYDDGISYLRTDQVHTGSQSINIDCRPIWRQFVRSTVPSTASS